MKNDQYNHIERTARIRCYANTQEQFWGWGELRHRFYKVKYAHYVCTSGLLICQLVWPKEKEN